MRVPDTCPLPPGATVWGYLRDSGGDRQDRSVEQQQAVLAAYCERHQLVLERVFADASRPGDSAEQRAALWELLAAVRDRFDQVHDRRRREEVAARLRHGVVFWTFARLGRDRVETAFIRNDLRMRGLAVTSLADEILTGNEDLDPILEEMLAFKAQLDLRVISAEAKRGLHHVVSLRDTDPTFLAHNPGWQPTGAYLGIFTSPVTPRGYRKERITLGKRRGGGLHRVQRLVPDPDTWDRARLAWRMRVVDEATYDQIHEATHLYKNAGAYTTFFKNRIYTGVLEYGDQVYGTPDDPFVPPLIPAEWYEVEQERRTKRAARRRKGGRHDPAMPDPRITSRGRLLSGLLVCARCGSRLHADALPEGVISTTGRKRRAWPFYRCSRASNGHCDAGKVHAPLIERAVIDRLVWEVLTPERLRDHLDEFSQQLDSHRQGLEEQLAALRSQLSTASRQADNLADALAERPDSPTLLRRLDDVEARQRQLRQEIRAMEAQLAMRSAPVFSDRELAQLIRQALDNLGQSGEDKESARRTLSTFIDRVEVEPGKTIEARIFYRFAVQGLDLMPPRDGQLIPCALGDALVEISRR